jgi:hypothetical protein
MTRRKFTKVIIDLPERFIATYHKHRISIVLTDKGEYDITVTAPDGCNVVETIERLKNMNEAKDYAIADAQLEPINSQEMEPLTSPRCRKFMKMVVEQTKSF